MNILIIKKSINQKKSAMEIRLDKIIDFLGKNNHVYILSNIGKIKNKKNIIHISMGKSLKIKMIGTILYGNKIRRNITKIIEKYDIKMVYTQESFIMNNIKDTNVIKIYDVLGLMQSESIIKDNSVEAKIKHLYYKNIENKALGIADYILTVNEAHKERIGRKNVFVFRDGVNNIFFKKYKKKKNNKIVISFVGSFFRDRLKGIIDIIPKLVQNNNNLFFEIIGDGRFISEYKNKVKKLNCESNITFFGHIDNAKVYNALQNSDICFSDDWSYIGFPTKVFEYMAMGKAILVEDTPAVREIITPGKNGLLYKNPEDFEKKILLLAKNPDLRKKLGEQARKDAKKHTWNIREKEFNKILSGIYEKK